MYLDVNSWIWGKISTNVGLLALCPKSHMTRSWPNSFVAVPILAYMSANQNSGAYAENVPIANSVSAEFHIFVAYTDSHTAIAQALDSVLTGMRFTLAYANELEEPQNKVRHLVLKYTRGVTVASDLL
jgi:hypothetical protein